MSPTLSLSWSPLVQGQGWPPNIQPAPGDFSASLGAEIAFFFIAGALVVVFALPWAIKAAVRSRNYIPLIVMASGLICSLLEPMLDLLGHLHWANNLRAGIHQLRHHGARAHPAVLRGVPGARGLLLLLRDPQRRPRTPLRDAAGDGHRHRRGHGNRRHQPGHLPLLRRAAVQLPELPLLVGLHQRWLVRHDRRHSGLRGPETEGRAQSSGCCWWRRSA